MDYAAQRLDHRGRRRFQRRRYLDRVHRRHGDKLREPARQSSDSVLAVELALMTVLSTAILTKNLAPPADAVQSLVHHHSIAIAQILNGTADLFYNAGNFVSKNLRLERERNRLSVLVRVVVCMTSKDVRIGATQTDRRHTNQYFIRRDRWARNVSHFETLHVAQDTRLHCHNFRHRDRWYQAGLHHAARQTVPLFHARRLRMALTAIHSRPDGWPCRPLRPRSGLVDHQT